jgi:hypothetical protein
MPLWLLHLVLRLPRRTGVSKKSTYSEPTVLWRLRNLDERLAHALIIPSGPKATALWFIGSTPQKARDFRSWRGAIEWLNDERTTLETSGWSWWERPQSPVRPGPNNR